jgi:hypothetical protein
MIRIVQISAVALQAAGQSGEDLMRVFCLMEDGKMAMYDVLIDTWTPIVMPEGYDQEYVGAISTTMLPAGFELVRNNRTKTWTWRKIGSQAIPPPSIEGEVGEIFDSKDDAVNDAKQRHMLKVIEQEQPRPEHLPI